MNISVIICCYNSENRIIQTLHYLKNQEIRNLTFEIVLVDNNSVDRTTDIVKEYWMQNDKIAELRIVKELKSGLVNARKCGVLTATGEVIIFCDDDNWLSPNFLFESYNMLMSNHRIGAMCGKNIPVSSGVFPDWFTTYQKNYAVGVLSLKTGDISEHGWLWGAGLSIRRKYLIDLWRSGFRHYTLDRNGSEISSGGDVEICKWILLNDLELWYNNEIYLKHQIPIERLNLEYLNKLFNANRQIADLFKKYDMALFKIGRRALFLYFILNFPRLIYRMTKNKITIRDEYYIYHLLKFFGIKRRESFWFQIEVSINKFSNYKNEK